MTPEHEDMVRCCFWNICEQKKPNAVHCDWHKPKKGCDDIPRICGWTKNPLHCSQQLCVRLEEEQACL